MIKHYNIEERAKYESVFDNKNFCSELKSKLKYCCLSIEDIR
jgi:hypothetical protein